MVVVWFWFLNASKLQDVNCKNLNVSTRLHGLWNEERLEVSLKTVMFVTKKGHLQGTVEDKLLSVYERLT